MNQYKDMLETIFAGKGADETIALSTITQAGAINNRIANESRMALGAAGAEYYCVSTTRNTRRRTLDDVVKAYVIVCDDVGTKSKEPPVDPSYKLESSPGNFQYGYLLWPFDVSTQAGREYYDACTLALAEAGYNDPGCRSATRIVRTVDSLNHKNGFVSKIEWLNREECWELPELMKAMGITVGGGGGGKKPVADSGETAATGDMADLLKGDNLHGNVMVFVARKVAAGLSDDEIRFMLQGMAGQIAAARPDRDISVLLGAELTRLLDGARLKGFDLGAPELTEEQMARRRAAQMEEARRIGAGEDAGENLPELFSLNEAHARFTYIESGGLVYDNLRPRHLLPIAEFKAAMCCNRTAVMVDGKQKNQSTVDLWMKSKARVSVQGLTFAAGAGPVTLDPNGRISANLWDGWHLPDVSPEAVAARGAGLFVKHVEWLFGDSAPKFLDFLAHMMQKPEELPHTAWLHVSSQTGTGRGWLSIVLSLLTRGYCANGVDLAKLLESQFNQVLSGKVLVMVDEIREAGGQRWSNAQKLKALITTDVRQINAKHMAPFTEVNSARWFLSSNHRSALPIDEGDRRFEVVICDKPRREDAYYERLYEAKKDPAFIRAVAEFLLRRDISGFKAGASAELSAAKEHLISSMQAPEVVAMKEVARDYPYRMITGAQLMARCGLEMDTKKAVSFSHMAEDAGWIRVGRFQSAGKAKVTVYCRNEDAERFLGANNRVMKAFLPVVDGGDAIPAIGPAE